MKKKAWRTLLLVLSIAALALMIAWPHDVWFIRGFRFHPGLDLKGGTRMVYELDLSKVANNDQQDAIESVVKVIEQRINIFGLIEPLIQHSKIGDKESVVMELPGVQDIAQAKQLIGQTALLEFYKPTATAVSEDGAETELENIPSFEPSELTGADLKKATVTFSSGSSGKLIVGSPQISLEFNASGKEKFKKLTEEFLGQPIAIVLDGQMISAPTVQSVISDGQAVITGQFTVDEAKQLATQLNAGALPVPVQLIEERTVGASLGEISVKQSLLAGLIGFLLIGFFMTIYYRLEGLLATIALVLYVIIVAAIFQWWAITLTLAGIAGFILSMGIAVDANILIFERMKEELRLGKPINLAIEEGFRRAMSSIRDSNVSALITATILYFSTTGLVKNFAVTLAIGILVSLFTAIFVTKTFLRLALREPRNLKARTHNEKA